MVYTRDFEVGKRYHAFKAQLSHDDDMEDEYIDLYAFVDWDRVRERAVWKLVKSEARRNIVIKHLDQSIPNWRIKLTEEYY